MKTYPKSFPLLFFILISSFSFAQKRDSLNAKQVDSDTLIYIGGFTKEKAKSDIQKGLIQLFLPGGIISAPTKDGDQAFCEKYNLGYKSTTCTDHPLNYNLEMFHYLDETYGMDWRKEIRQDVIGLKIHINIKQ